MSTRENDGTQLQFGDDESSIALRRAWDRTLRALAPKLTATSESFLRTTEPLSLNGNLVVLAAPSRFAREWLEKRYGEVLRAQLQTHLGLPSLALRFVLASSDLTRQPLTPRLPLLESDPEEQPAEQSLVPVGDKRSKSQGGENSNLPAKRQKPLPPELSIPLSPKYTFDNFVVGKSNRLAHAGAVAIAENPGSVYNPLFLYGAPGLGKTHLMHAIGHAIREKRPDARIAYVSGESFTNNYISSLRDRKSDDFRSVYRNVDVWLVDDIQTIAGKEHTKEEFFHTFNTLHQTGRQIVLSSDCAPRDLRLMDERLRSRFECGLIADVAPPDVEMRIAILQKKAMLEGLDIPDEVLMYMAGLIQSNIRALEGALIRLMAYASLSKSAVTKELARDVLGSYFVERRKVLSVEGETVPEGSSPLRALPLPPVVSRLGMLQQSAKEQFQYIVETVARHFNIDPAYIAGEGSAATARRREYAAPRQIAIYLAREKTPLPVTELAHLFGGVNHSAISHAHKKMVKQIQSDPQLLVTLNALQQKLGE